MEIRPRTNRLALLKRSLAQSCVWFWIAVVCATAASNAGAAPLPSALFGAGLANQGEIDDGNLGLLSAAGAGVTRVELPEGSDTDAVVAALAAHQLRLYPSLGLASSHGAAADASAMASYVTAFAERYGPGGTFWAANPQLPYLPVESFEIGNEPDIEPNYPSDYLHLHYWKPADYAEVYEASRTALHQVDPSGVAVVGGMLDSGDTPLSKAETYLSAIGPMDAVGFHPYRYDLGTMEQDTTALRSWLDANGDAGVPIDINEFDDGDWTHTANTTVWAYEVATYTDWAACTPSLDVDDIQPFFWGGDSSAGAGNGFWYALSDSTGALTPIGSRYLAEVNSLTTTGCPTTRGGGASVGAGHSGGNSSPTPGASSGKTKRKHRKKHKRHHHRKRHHKHHHHKRHHRHRAARR